MNTLIAALAAIALSSGGASPIVADATVKSSPISVFQAAYTPDDSGRGALWIAFTNRSRELVQRFVIRGRWLDGAGVERGTFTSVLKTVIGPGERTTATIGGVTAGPAGTRMEFAVDRVRFNDLALWVAPEPTAAPLVAAVAPSVSHRSVLVAAGTSLNISMVVPTDSETAGNGDVVPFVADRDIVVDGAVVIARGALGYGHVDDVGRAANWGRSGTLRFVADAVTAVDGTMVRLHGEQRVAPARVRSRFVLDGMFVKGRPAILPARAALVVASSADERVSVGPPMTSTAQTAP